MFPIDEKAREEALEWARKFTSTQKWTFAKTYAKTTPHEYIVVHKGDSRRSSFKKMFEILEKYGTEEEFFGMPWIYLYLGDDYKYFAADGKGWEEDRYILNRAKADIFYGKQN